MDRFVPGVVPEPQTVAQQAIGRDGVLAVELEGQSIALIGGMMLAQPLVQDAQQSPDFGAIRRGVEGASEVALGFGEPPPVEGLPCEDQVGWFRPRRIPVEGSA
jgi:hypothetical protein